jgi:hypothetical protein
MPVSLFVLGILSVMTRPCEGALWQVARTGSPPVRAALFRAQLDSARNQRNFGIPIVTRGVTPNGKLKAENPIKLLILLVGGDGLEPPAYCV